MFSGEYNHAGLLFALKMAGALQVDDLPLRPWQRNHSQVALRATQGF